MKKNRILTLGKKMLIYNIYNKLQIYKSYITDNRRFRLVMSKIMTDNECIYISCLGGIGDTVFLLSFIEEFKNQKGVKKVKFLIRRNHKDILKMFGISDKDIIILTEKNALLLRRKKDVRLDNYIYGHPDLEILNPEELLVLDGITLMDLYRVCVLHIDANSSLKKISIDFIEKNAKANMIILAPYCVSTPKVENIFWEKLVREIKRKNSGYMLYTNVKNGKEKKIKGTSEIHTDLKNLCCLAGRCKMFISVRSGLCDLLAMCGICLTVIYPDEKNNSTYIKYNLRDMGFVENISEFIVGSKEENIIDTIVEVL